MVTLLSFKILFFHLVRTRRSPLLGLFLICAPPVRAEFALRDGDTLVFLGDSITAARGYPKIVEQYTLLRYPDRKVRFVNAGQGGDTASGCVQRLDRDVFSQGATVVTVAFGVNDIGWGMKADAEHKQKYLDGIREIIARCDARHVRAIICSPAITAEAPDPAEVGFLQTMTDEGLALAKSLGAGVIDLQRGMRDVQRRIVEANAKESDPKKWTRLHVEDGVHLNDLGQLTMAYAMLKGLGAPETVASATIDAASAQVSDTRGCAISELEKSEGTLAFIRVDERWPLTLGPLSALNFRWIPMPDGINRYELRVTGLPEGDYELEAGGRPLGRASAGNLAKGINLTTMTADGWQPGGPWNVQSDIVKGLVEARDQLGAADRLRAQFGEAHPNAKQLDADFRALDAQITAVQRATAKPHPYRFVIRPAAKKGS